jgi:hypothetical protein
MADQPDNNQYGLTPKEARMLGLQQESSSVDNKDVELESQHHPQGALHGG